VVVSVPAGGAVVGGDVVCPGSEPVGVEDSLGRADRPFVAVGFVGIG
jgi:hypothetical protein